MADETQTQTQPSAAQPLTDVQASPPTSWWGKFTVPRGQCRRWQIGPLQLWLHREVGEWRISVHRHEDPLLDALVTAEPCDPASVPAVATTERHAHRGSRGDIEIGVRLAPRPVVCRSAVQFHVPPGESVSLYTSTPVWLRISLPNPEILLTELPVFRPSDTWFGPNNREGELCYASRTWCRTRLDQVTRLPHRCVSTVSIANRSALDLPFERIALPVPSLPLFADRSDRLWTPDCSMEWRGPELAAKVTVARHPPKQAEDTRLLAAARNGSTDGVVSKVLESLFSDR